MPICYKISQRTSISPSDYLLNDSPYTFTVALMIIICSLILLKDQYQRLQ
ncbi:MAG: hypothetical protein RQ885_14760 [Desulfurococcales archaeon]|nr:hypothetical protein [Desulfurococcales archaeon]